MKNGIPQLPEKEKCTGCGGCAATCTSGCISMHPDHEGFRYPRIDTIRCSGCGSCEKVCPQRNVRIFGHQKPKAFAAYSNDKQIRKAAASGGMASLLGRKILDDGGTVFGAAYLSKGMETAHIRVNDAGGLYRIMGSKYMQSSVGECFSQIRDLLSQKQKVLFIGTPCQVEGLKGYLKTDDDHLLCVDLVCHGVPSSALWKKYARYQEKKARSHIVDINMKSKVSGWREPSVVCRFANGKSYQKPVIEDPYMLLFYKGLSIRPSCYACSSRCLDRMSDITLADFWGIEDVCPEIADDLGTSLVLLHTKKGRELLDEISEDATILEVDLNAALHKNPSATKERHNPREREAFFRDSNVMEFDEILKRYVPVTLHERAVRLLRKTGLLPLAYRMVRLLRK